LEPAFPAKYVELAVPSNEERQADLLPAAQPAGWHPTHF